MEKADKTIEYYPNKNYRIVAFILFIIDLLPFGLSILLLFSKDTEGFWLTFLPFLLFLTIPMFLILLSRLQITFTNNAVYIKHDNKSKIMEYRYEDYPFAYYCKSYKGWMYLILSPCEIDKKKAKSIAHLSGETTQYDSCVIISLNESSENEDIIRKLIHENVKKVYEVK